MIEMPEAIAISKQLGEAIRGKTVKQVVVAHSPHKWAWSYKDPSEYPGRLEGKRIGESRAFGSFIETDAESAQLLFSEGVRLQYIEDAGKIPKKHQLLLEFADTTALVASIQMYGGLYCYPAGEFDNSYYNDAKAIPSPVTDGFDWDYFDGMLSAHRKKNLSVKAFLATEQRIPGLGNGVLQDILYNARIHPKRKLATLSDEEIDALFRSIKDTLAEMAEAGGRDTEKDIYGNTCGYHTKLSRNTLGLPCPACQTPIKKTAYMGGTVYFCSQCQKEQ